MIIDVSHNNGVIDWNKVNPHIEKAIIRVGYGNDATNQDDRQFQQNVSECRRLGIPFDFYIYSYANSVSEAKSEAKHALRLAANDPDAIIYFDSEEPGTQSVAMICAKAFRDEIKAAGRKVGLYCSESWYKSYLSGIEGFDKLWIAKYGANNGSMNTRPNIECDIWQYSSRGSVPGINGYVDVNTVLKQETPVIKPKESPNGVYRLYNPNDGEHFFTMSVPERNGLIDAGWKYEDVAWKAPTSGKTPVIRLVNKNGGFHMFTTSPKEADNLSKAGWIKEGVPFYSDDAKTVPIFRLYDTTSGHHMFTASAVEKQDLLKRGWKDEGVAFYGM